MRTRNWPIGKQSRLPDLEDVILMQPKKLEGQGSPLNLNHIQSVFALLTWASWGVCMPWGEPGQETRKVVDSTFLICTPASSMGNLGAGGPWGLQNWSPKSEHLSLGSLPSVQRPSSLQGGGIQIC